MDYQIVSTLLHWPSPPPPPALCCNLFCYFPCISPPSLYCPSSFSPFQFLQPYFCGYFVSFLCAQEDFWKLLSHSLVFLLLMIDIIKAEESAIYSTSNQMHLILFKSSFCTAPVSHSHSIPYCKEQRLVLKDGAYNSLKPSLVSLINKTFPS